MIRSPGVIRDVFTHLEEGTMFADYISDSSWDNRSHRGITTLASFALQFAAVGVLLLLPLIYTEGLPQLKLITDLVAPSAPPAPVAIRPSATTASNLLPDGTIMAPSHIPTVTQVITDEVAPPRSDIGIGGVPGGTADHWTDNPVMNAIAQVPVGIVPSFRPLPSTRPVRISRMMEGNLVHRVQPDYPAIAKSARIQGEVVLAAVISKDGTIENLRVLKGHPLLVKAALEAVQQWRYRPYLLNGDPVEVETQVTVNFVLSGG
jgi:periplasmic protein TonB